MGSGEQGLFGSKHFVRSLLASQYSWVHWVVNMDKIGTLNSAVLIVLLEGRAILHKYVGRPRRCSVELSWFRC
ncbi:Zn-dependent exopeptidase M28 (plasmid) [Rhizobium leguminosarum]|nr:Zn-dependent exopeptidase M28 [Rhizobium leguminosarum]